MNECIAVDPTSFLSTMAMFRWENMVCIDFQTGPFGNFQCFNVCLFSMFVINKHQIFHGMFVCCLNGEECLGLTSLCEMFVNILCVSCLPCLSSPLMFNFVWSKRHFPLSAEFRHSQIRKHGLTSAQTLA